MILTAQDLIKAAMRKLGILAKSETPSADETADALQALNMMIDEWGAQKLMATASIRESFPLVAGQQSYTIGIGANFNTTVPIAITYAFFRDNTNMDTPLNIITREEFYAFGDKQIIQARPLSLFFDAGPTQQATYTGTIYLYFTPDGTSAYTLFLDSQKPFNEFATLNDTVTFPPSYYKALVYNLAVEMAPEYGISIPREVEMVAIESKETVEAMNAAPILAGLDLPKGKGGSFNWVSGEAN